LSHTLHRFLLKISGPEHPDPHRPTAGIKQWIAPAINTQLNQLFHTSFHQEAGMNTVVARDQDHVNTKR
jgi:hypothetical protein